MSEPDDIKLIFIEEAKDCLNIIFDMMTVWASDLNDNSPLREILAQLHTIKGGARLIKQPLIATTIHKLEEIFKIIEDNKIAVVLSLHGKLLFALDYILSLIEALENNTEMIEDVNIIENILQDVLNVSETKLENDENIVSIFVQEVEEIIIELKEDIIQSQENSSAQLDFQSIHRKLHTLKGSARLMGLIELGDYTHKLEEIIGNYQVNNIELSSEIYVFLDNVINDIEQFSKQLVVDNAHPKLNFGLLEKLEVKNNSVKVSSESSGLISPNIRKLTTKHSTSKIAKDVVRLEVSMLESLSNLATTANITSSHVSQQLISIRNMIIESGSNIAGLLDQFRNIKLGKFNSVSNDFGKIHEEFDTLELDRYTTAESTIHHLIGNLNQLMLQQETLVKNIHACEGWVREQRKATRGIEENLIRSRLIPFENLKPRFERIVRQVSNELNKEVVLEYSRLEGELDRNILEKIMSPIEHLIRNAIDHGIEDSSVRMQKGKPEIGKIQLSLVRKGPEVLIEMTDDGQGLNGDKIYKSAVAKGLISANAKLTESEIYKLVMTPGFSTRDKVSQISGRGIGMDVVNSEIKRLGGSFSISSELGKGATFSLRLPFTLSLNKSLIFSLNNIVYALPLSALAAVTRISSDEYRSRIDTNERNIEYANENFTLVKFDMIFGNIIESSSSVSQLPLLLIGHEKGIALAVDKLLESREIVVKSVGPQLKYIPVISGATLLEDGTVAMVIDPLVLIQQVNEKKSVRIHVHKQDAISHSIMIVDDSLTVRKITEGLLKRYQYDIVTATDGVVALEKMKLGLPDIILLDVEMPNMDGFELLRVMKKDKTLAAIPIIMITSRSSNKHKQKAIGLGADLYLTKPFKEEELIASIKELIG
jgi:chemosensory pili system protein ChpA (sensor histidine kinase/response regulator)